MSTFFQALARAEQDRVRRPTSQAELTSDRSSVFSSAESGKGLEQLRLLFDYSKFQIGLNTAVATIFAAAIALEPAVFKFHRGFLSLARAFICLSGMAAGIIASRCARFTSRRELWTTPIGPFRWSCLTGEDWTHFGHACFGLALVAAVLSVLLSSGKWGLIVGCAPDLAASGWLNPCGRP